MWKRTLLAVLGMQGIIVVDLYTGTGPKTVSLEPGSHFVSRRNSCTT